MAEQTLNRKESPLLTKSFDGPAVVFVESRMLELVIPTLLKQCSVLSSIVDCVYNFPIADQPESSIVNMPL
jgi:hypothetical protein